MSYLSMMRAFENNARLSRTLYNTLVVDPKFEQDFAFEPHNGSFAFRVKFVNATDSSEYQNISVSYPPDAYGMIETMLIDGDGNLLDESLDRYESADDLKAKLIELANKLV